MRRPARPSAVAILVSAVLAIAGAACHRARGTPAGVAAPDEATVVLTAASEGFLLTWIDDKGDFHVETRAEDVPLMGRDAVRVVDPNKEDGMHPERIFVADLRQLRPDGTYPVRTMTHADFEALAVARREKEGPTLDKGGAPAAPSSAPSGRGSDPGATPPPSRVAVIIYGAEWCSACHDAARYLRQKGIPYVEKDVEKDPSAAREMQAKLAKNGLRSGSIPVIDVRGRVMVGFNPQQVDGALGEPL